VSWRLVGLVPLLFSLPACGAIFDIYSPGQIHLAVQAHPNRPGVYLIYYKPKQMIDEFGPGWGKTLAAVRQAKSNEEINAIWEDALAVAVPKYMAEKDLIPGECVNGIAVISSSFDEGGGGTTSFRCRESQEEERGDP
jgi:hypothetical protein